MTAAVKLTEPLTKTIVQNLPYAANGAMLYYDAELPGFGVRVGSKVKAYFVERRVSGRTVRVTIGKHGVGWTAEKARKEAERLRVEMDKGNNPIQAKKDAKAREDREKAERKARAVTLEDVYKAYVAARNLKASTKTDYDRVMKEGFEDWKATPIAELTKDMIQARHRKTGKNSEARANLSMRVLRALFNFAAATYEDAKGNSIIIENPVRRLSQTRSWYTVKRRQTVLRKHQVGPWFDAVNELEDTTATEELRDDHGRYLKGTAPMRTKADTVRDYLLLLLFTGLRRSEAAYLRWADVDLKGRTLTIPDPKNRESHTLPLSDFLVTMMERRKAAAHENDVYVFVGETEDRKPIAEPRKQMARVEEASGVSFNLHDLRRTFATYPPML